MSAKMKIALALGAMALLGALAAAPAGAAPVLDLQMARTAAPLTHSDERLVFKVTLANAGSQVPNPGDTLQCQASAGGQPPAALSYQWLRNGQPTGATSPSYLVGVEDEGKSLQCKVTATNDPDDVLGTGSAYPPLSGVAVSLPPVVVAPAPSPAAPSGSSRPALGGPPPATPVGTATVTEGSNLITSVITAKGSGGLTSGSKVVTNVTTTTGKFIVGEEGGPQQVITGAAGAGIPPGTTVAKILSPTELELSQAVIGPGGSGVALEAGALPFQQDQKLSGAGIPPGAIITNVTGRALTISAPATASGSGVAIEGIAEETCGTPAGWSGTGITWSFQWLRNGQPIPGATGATYAVQPEDTEPPSFLQCEATAKDSLGREAVAISSGDPSRPWPPLPYLSPAGASATVPLPNPTAGSVTVEADLPVGTQALRAVGSGWACTKTPPAPPQPSKIKCSRADTLEAGDSYPALTLIAQVAADAPDTLVTKVCASGGGAASLPCAEDTVSGILPAVPFGFQAFETMVLDDLGGDFNQAGGHPFSAGASLQFNEHVKAEESAEAGVRAGNGFVREIRTETPPGFAGNPLAITEKCQTVADVIALPSACPAASVVGGITPELSQPQNLDNLPIYALEPEKGTPAQFAFGVAALRPGFAFTLTPELRPEDNYAVTLVAAPVSKGPELFRVEATLCGFGAKTLTEINGETRFGGCRKASDPQALERPFLTLPTKCGDTTSSTTRILADSWEHPGSYAEDSFTLPAPEGCSALSFEPTLKARPTTNAADSPTGLEVDLNMPASEDPEGTATAQLKKTVVTLPEGLVVNPSGANGLDACSSSQVKLGTNDPIGCPNASKIGSVEVTTPILDHPLPGALYVASPHDNPFGSLLALYLVVDSPDDGLLIKLPGHVEPDPTTGRLTTTFDQNPQAPVEDVQLKIRGGATAPLRTPAACGKYSTTSSLTPWSAPESGPPATPKDTWSISKGPGGGACIGSPPNEPAFEAGTASPIAASYSPFVVKLRREDGSQTFSAVSVAPPPGLLAKLAGTPYCPDSAVAAAEAKTGKQEQAGPSCPAASQVGTVVAGAGAGPSPYYATGKAYLAGPYKGAPLSLAIVTPAVAGPFDLGNVVVKTALYVDPETAKVTAVSDPLPQVLQGIPLDVRSVAISMDKPGFTLNPTSCDPMAVTGSLTSSLGQVAPLTSRFQVGECSRLGFKPSLEIKLKGKTKRSGHPALTATLTYPKGAYANIASASVALPHSEFLEQAHIRTICTRVQFAADACPKGAVYGKAKAITPLLDAPLEGPVYLRSSSNPLPDLVVDLRGQIHVALVGRVDSVNGGIRTTFASVPDAPVSRFTLQMQGGKKGLLVNSRDICKSANRAVASFQAHNGKAKELKPKLQAQCPKRPARKKHGQSRRR